MLKGTIDNRIASSLSRLKPRQKSKVLAYIRSLLEPGERKDILKYAGMFDSEDIRQMEQAIQEGCEKIDGNEW